MEKFEEVEVEVVEEVVEVVEGGGKEYRREQEYTRFLDSGFRRRFTFSFSVLMYCCFPGGVSSVSGLPGASNV